MKNGSDNDFRYTDLPVTDMTLVIVRVTMPKMIAIFSFTIT